MNSSRNTAHRNEAVGTLVLILLVVLVVGGAVAYGAHELGQIVGHLIPTPAAPAQRIL